MAPVVCIDGRLVRPEEAVVSVFDRGFLYGDSVYEVLRTHRGVPFQLEAHLTRLEQSAARIAMETPLPLERLREETLTIHQQSGFSESYLRIVVTRGSGKIGLDIALATEPRRIIVAEELSRMLPPPEVYRDGAEVAVVGVRKNLREAVDPAAKTGNYLNSVMALAEARRSGAYEALMLDHQGRLTEGASSNVFLVIAGLLLTPSLEVGILKGVTRTVVLDLAREAGIPALELPLTADTLERAEEVFITSSIREIVPITRVDGRRVGNGRPGRLTERLQSLFGARVERDVARVHDRR
jgi:branched-chain amino acid aminotransferase